MTFLLVFYLLYTTAASIFGGVKRPQVAGGLQEYSKFRELSILSIQV